MNPVVLLSQSTTWRDLLEANQLEALALEAAKDLADETALDAIGLDGNESPFGGHGLAGKTGAIVRGRPTAWQAHPHQWERRWPSLPTFHSSDELMGGVDGGGPKPGGTAELDAGRQRSALWA